MEKTTNDNKEDYGAKKSVVIIGLLISFLAMAAAFLGPIKLCGDCIPPPPTPTPTPREEARRIEGGWRSETSPNAYTIEPRGDHTFLLKESTTGNLIGLGNITNNKVVIKATHPIKKRSAIFDLQLSEDGSAMTGTMQGEHPDEKAFLSFKRLPAG